MKYNLNFSNDTVKSNDSNDTLQKKLVINPLLRNVVQWSDTLSKSCCIAARFLKFAWPFYDIAK